jgi:hypothetical protein
MRRKLLWTVSSICLFLASGCAVLGVAANAMPRNIAAKYAGLTGQSVAVMVWADRGLRIDWQTIQLDTATAIQSLLQQQQSARKVKELKDTTFPLQPRSVVRYQLDHPELEAMPVTEFAPNLGASRLIYIEIEHFATRSDMALEMYRGSATATLRIVEITDGTARVAYEENNVSAVFPKNARPEGDPRGRDDLMYAGTVRTLAQEIVNRLVTHEEE